MSWDQAKITLSPRSKGCYLITDDIVKGIPQIKDYEFGILNLFLQHTSAAITINENWDPDVRSDLDSSLDRIVPEGDYYLHVDEGPDDSVSHIKSSTIGVSLSIPITNGKLGLGTWQGIYLCEFRKYRHSRNIIATVNGQKKK
ncbi:SPAC4A8.02c UPF0047 protein C4A8.02c [Candida maltosa Xu316]